ncbi:MAG TPA: hypothetical protein VN709_08315 [Terriglobales bacterium]|nr:hypothetical protein [Terriglobales bacterium]
MADHLGIRFKRYGMTEFGMADPPEMALDSRDWADPQVAANAEALYKAWNTGGDKALKAKLAEIKAKNASQPESR